MGQSFLGYWLAHKIHRESFRKLSLTCVLQHLCMLLKFLHIEDLAPESCLHWSSTGLPLTDLAKGRPKNSFVHKCHEVEADMMRALKSALDQVESTWPLVLALSSTSCATWFLKWEVPVLHLCRDESRT